MSTRKLDDTNLYPAILSSFLLLVSHLYLILQVLWSLQNVWQSSCTFYKARTRATFPAPLTLLDFFNFISFINKLLIITNSSVLTITPHSETGSICNANIFTYVESAFLPPLFRLSWCACVCVCVFSLLTNNSHKSIACHILWYDLEMRWYRIVCMVKLS